MPFALPKLPYEPTALEPNISAKTLEFHHGKHHKAYVDKTNELISGTPMEKKSLEEIIEATAKDESKKVLFNNAAQAWNHTFFWHSLSPKSGGKPGGSIAKAIEKDFGSFDKFSEEFSEAAKTQFGSGWAWLTMDKSGKLKVEKSPNAVNPITQNEIPILTLDVWEHAYYLDYQNKRPDFIKIFLEKLANWEFAEKNFQDNSVYIASKEMAA